VDGIRIHRALDLLPDEVTTLDGIPLTTPARTLLDLGEVCTAREVEQAVATGLRLKLVARDELRTMVERHPKHRGARVLRTLLDADAAPAFTRSQAEEKFLALIRRARLPAPELNVHVLEYEVDALWRSAHVIAEVDGFAFHRSARSFTLDRRRDAELTAAGYRVLRFTWTDVTEQSHATVARLAQALARS
jgi:very-short-patch-repair endonuclease